MADFVPCDRLLQKAYFNNHSVQIWLANMRLFLPKFVGYGYN